MSADLKVAVVGHTNTGKTSLLRTLARDEYFGKVSDEPATTRHVEGMQLLLSDGEPIMLLFDTPGLEDPAGVLDALDHLSSGGRFDGPERIRRFLESAEAQLRYEQEAKVLRQMLQSDAAIYVIDSREPLLGKYREELTILTYCAIPLLPVLNFIAGQGSREVEWREQLARVNLHAVVAFDSVVFDEAGERRLFEKLRTLLDRHAGSLARLVEDRRRQGQWLRRAAAEQTAELLIDAAACLRVVPAELDAGAVRALTLGYQDEAREREQRCVDGLLELFRFSRRHYADDGFPLVNGAWGTDLFSPEALRHHGLRAGGGAVAGAAAGAAIDAATLGTSLGLAAAGGATLGALLGTSIPLRERLWARLRGRAEWRISDATLRLMALRQLALIRALLRRGHAAQEPVAAGTAKDGDWSGGQLPKPLREARLNPRWSRLNGSLFDATRADRHTAVQRLTEHLVKSMETS